MTKPIIYTINGGKNDISGNNTGNIVIWDSLISQINYSKIIRDSISSLADYNITKGSTILIPFASCINNATKVQPLVDFIIKNDIIPVLVGIGIQSGKYSILKLNPSLIKLLQLSAERAFSIGVRGYYSADILNRIGIKNVDVIGCPSIFFGGKDFNIPNINLSEIKNTAVHTTFYTPEKLGLEYLIKVALNNKSDFIAQNEFKLLDALSNNNDDIINDEIKNYYKNDNAKTIISKYFQSANIKLFYNTKDWRDDIRQHYDFVYGTRFHGNIISLQAGIPAFFISCDYRTLDMCEFLRLPYLDIESLNTLKPSLETMYSLANYEEFNKLYPDLYRNYISFLANNNISHKLKKFDNEKPLLAIKSDLTVALKLKPRLFNDDAQKLISELNDAQKLVSELDNKVFKINFYLKKLLNSKSYRFFSLFFVSLRKRINAIKVITEQNNK